MVNSSKFLQRDWLIIGLEGPNGSIRLVFCKISRTIYPLARAEGLTLGSPATTARPQISIANLIYRSVACVDANVESQTLDATTNGSLAIDMTTR